MSEMHAHSQQNVTPPATGDTRAGPGDAGATDHPEVLPHSDRSARRARAASRFTVAVILVGIVLVVLAWAIF